MVLTSAVAIFATSPASANMFLNENLINKEDYNPNTFHFEMVYGLAILTLQNELTQNITEQFFADMYQMQYEELKKIMEKPEYKEKEVVYGSMNAKLIAVKFEEELYHELDHLS